MRTPVTDVPGLVIRGRVAFLPADLDRRYNRENLPDYANLLANLVHWALAGNSPLKLTGPGWFDCNLYEQSGRLVAHVVNLTATRQMPMDELIPVGPMKLALRVPSSAKQAKVKTLVAGTARNIVVSNGWAEVELGSILDHEVVVLEA